MQTRDDYAFKLPQELIAQKPLERRDQCRLLVFCRETGRWEHRYFSELPEILSALGKKVTLVRNVSKVIPARLRGRKFTGGKCEIFLGRELKNEGGQAVWECLVKPGLKEGAQVELAGGGTGKCLKNLGYTRVMQFDFSPARLSKYMQECGQTPVPAYIHSQLSEEKLREVYQTVYAEVAGSVAAPTAGMHFTSELLRAVQAGGVEVVDVTLHVSLGTFLGVKEQDISKHQMHAEAYQVSGSARRRIRQARERGEIIMAVGTTTLRTLETVVKELEVSERDLSGETDIFIYPPYKFQMVGALLTNFHLPYSTLLMLVAAFVSAPNSQEKFRTWGESSLGRAYQDAIRHGYRFFSFGDAMLIL